MNDGGSAHICKNNGPAFVARLLAPLLWALVILWLSLTSSPPEIPGVLGWDKLLHAGAYGLLTLLVIQALAVFLPKRISLYAVSSLLCIFYGGVVEVLQMVTDAGRTAEWWDLVADIIGIVLACVIFSQLPDVISRQIEGRRHADGQ